MFQHTELPIDQLQQLGFYHQGQLLLESPDVAALLAGRRTNLLPIHELQGKGFLIERLDAKLSLSRNSSGDVELQIHPIYRLPRSHPLLSDGEMDSLIEGKKDFICRLIEQEEGRHGMYNIEYDNQTRDFVGYQVAEVQAPDLINGMLLSGEQQAAFKRGEELLMRDGTRVMHRASEPKGIISDRKALILSVLLDGGISYLLLTGLRSILKDGRQENHMTASFQKTLAEMQGSQGVDTVKVDPDALGQEPGKFKAHGISR